MKISLCETISNLPISSHDLKVRKYASLVGDLLVDYSAETFCFEVSVCGHISKINKVCLKSFLFMITGQKRPSAVKLIDNVSRAALLGSFSIFSARNGTRLVGQRLRLCFL